jgi:hypothetical protein
LRLAISGVNRDVRNPNDPAGFGNSDFGLLLAFSAFGIRHSALDTIAPGGSGASTGCRRRSADLKSAVSQDCILWGVGWAGSVENSRSAADFKSAIRQSATLRYLERIPDN